MTLNKNNWFFPLIVLVLGTVSCSKEKEVQIQTQGYSAPQMGAKDSQGRMQWLEDIKSLDLASSLNVDLVSENGQKQSPAIVEITTICRQEGSTQTYTQSDFWTQKSEIPVLETLPVSLLTAFASDTATCDFTLKLTGTNGSQLLHFLDDITLTSLNRFDNFSWPLLDKPEVIYETDLQEVIPNSPNAAVQLLCQEAQFQSSSHNNSQTLQQFIEPKLLEIQKNINHYTQKCRFLSLSQQQRTISKEFLLSLPPVQPQIELTTLPQNQILGHLRKDAFISLKLYNPTRLTMNLTLDQIQSSSITFRPIYAIDMWGVFGNVREAQLQWNIPDHPWILARESQSVRFQIPPQQSFQFTLSIAPNYKCAEDYQLYIPKPHQLAGGLKVGWVGFNYKLNLQSQLKQKISEQYKPVIPWSHPTLLGTQEAPYANWNLQYALFKQTIPRLMHRASTDDDFLKTLLWDRTYDTCLLQ